LEPGVAAARVKVGIETDRGPWVAALAAAGYEVFAINPMSGLVGGRMSTRLTSEFTDRVRTGRR